VVALRPSGSKARKDGARRGSESRNRSNAEFIFVSWACIGNRSNLKQSFEQISLTDSDESQGVTLCRTSIQKIFSFVWLTLVFRGRGQPLKVQSFCLHEHINSRSAACRIATSPQEIFHAVFESLKPTRKGYLQGSNFCLIFVVCESHRDSSTTTNRIFNSTH
jgi:hypothetical protein